MRDAVATRAARGGPGVVGVDAAGGLEEGAGVALADGGEEEVGAGEVGAERVVGEAAAVHEAGRGSVWA